MRLFLNEIMPYLILFNVICLMFMIFNTRAGFSNYSSPWIAANLASYKTVFSASNQRSSFCNSCDT
jgi:hypothetical protein